MENETCTQAVNGSTEKCSEKRCTEREAFECREISDIQKEEINKTRDAFMAVLDVLNGVTSPQSGRYLAMAKRALEDSCMYAVKAISHA